MFYFQRSSKNKQNCNLILAGETAVALHYTVYELTEKTCNK